MYYEFQTSVGMFRIEPDPDDSTKVLLSIDNVSLGKYDSPAAAAAAVFGQNTGWERWDLLRQISGPRDLSEWRGT
jgi:hypothetical protein